MWNLPVFAVIGLLTGAAARLLYPGRRSTHILGWHNRRGGWRHDFLELVAGRGW
jgi:hypothetical protein